MKKEKKDFIRPLSTIAHILRRPKLVFTADPSMIYRQYPVQGNRGK